MVLEATMIIIDNSEYMRNGDYTPSRYQAQLDTVEVIFRRKINSNPENTVGLMTMAGESSVFLSNLTADYGQILSGLHSSKIDGQSHFINSIQVACLALRNRQNKIQKQRIIVFVGSPIEDSQEELIKLAKKLKKNNVFIDLINFGEQQQNLSKLEEFINIVDNGENNSHLVTIPQGPYLLYEQVDKTAILRDQDQLNNMNGGGEFADFGTGTASGGNDFDFGMDDPNMDPELALAIRLSLEEENTRKEREAAAAAAAAAAANATANASTSGEAETKEEVTESNKSSDTDKMEED
jgi:26S proteasome regulatory subunit N10